MPHMPHMPHMHRSSIIEASSPRVNSDVSSSAMLSASIKCLERRNQIWSYAAYAKQSFDGPRDSQSTSSNSSSATSPRSPGIASIMCLGSDKANRKLITDMWIICIRLCIYIYTYIYIHICVHIYIHMQAFQATLSNSFWMSVSGACTGGCTASSKGAAEGWKTTSSITCWILHQAALAKFAMQINWSLHCPTSKSIVVARTQATSWPAKEHLAFPWQLAPEIKKNNNLCPISKECRKNSCKRKRRIQSIAVLTST